MNTIILYLFYLIATPSPSLACVLWLNTPPTASDVVAACGEIALDEHTLTVRYQAEGGDVVCTLPDAGQIYGVAETCQLDGRLDQYRLEVWQPPASAERVVCTVKSEFANPTPAEIAAQCDPAAVAQYESGALEVRFIKTIEETPPQPTTCTPPAPQTGAGLFKRPETAAELASKKKYYLLAGKLLWFGYGNATECNGLSGVDAQTGAATECGLESVFEQTVAWQNALDDAIFAAAVDHHVPARLLKEIIARETQFWVWTGEHGEAGLIQITEDGADLVMRMTREGYHLLPTAQREAERLAWLASLRCETCTIDGTIDHAREMMPEYARALAAYYCQYGSWQAALTGWNEQHTILGG